MPRIVSPPGRLTHWHGLPLPLLLLLSLTLTFSSCDSQPDGFSPEQYTFRMPEIGPVEEAYRDEGGWYLNRLRGYLAWLYPEFKVAVLPDGFYIVDERSRVFGRITFVYLDEDSINALWRNIAQKIRKYTNQEAYFRKTKIEESEVYHWWLPKSQFPSVLFPRIHKRGTYEVHVILKGMNHWYRVEILTYKPSTDSTLRRKLWKVVQSLKVLPREERIPYQVQGVPASTQAYLVPVPEGFQASGTTFPMGTLQEASWQIQHIQNPDIFVRRDVINVSQAYTMGVPLYNATLNGTPINYQGGIPTTKSQILQMINAIWGGGWQVVQTWEKPFQYQEQQMRQQMIRQTRYTYGIMHVQPFAHVFLALFQQGNLYRYAYIVAGGATIQGYSLGSSSLYCSLTTFQTPAEDRIEMSHLLASIVVDALPNPQWVARVRQQNIQAQRALDRWTMQRIEAIRQEGAMFRQYLQSIESESQMYQDVLYEHQEFTSDINEAWGNILGEKIYAQDPTTGEVFYLDDVGGNYLRNPETGTIITGIDPVATAQLEELGWQRMNLSYEPF